MWSVEEQNHNRLYLRPKLWLLQNLIERDKTLEDFFAVKSRYILKMTERQSCGVDKDVVYSNDIQGLVDHVLEERNVECQHSIKIWMDGGGALLEDLYEHHSQWNYWAWFKATSVQPGGLRDNGLRVTGTGLLGFFDTYRLDYWRGPISTSLPIRPTVPKSLLKSWLIALFKQRR